jgi:hypothetical protein
VVSGVTPAEGNLAVGQRDQAMVGDGDAVSVAAEILQYVLGSALVKKVVSGEVSVLCQDFNIQSCTCVKPGKGLM